MRLCENCSSEILLPFAKKYCSHSCRAAVVNSNRKIKTHKKHSYPTKRCLVSFCETCGIIMPQVSRRFCKSCLRKNRASKMQATSIEHELGGHTSKQQLYYASTQGFTCFLQSSYEITVATSLDKHFVKWTRPKPLKWLDSNNISHRYYPDFYLADYDIYLDPKNDYLIANDIVKINAVMSQNNVKILVLTKHELSWSIIKGLCL